MLEYTCKKKNTTMCTINTKEKVEKERKPRPWNEKMYHGIYIERDICVCSKQSHGYFLMQHHNLPYVHCLWQKTLIQELIHFMQNITTLLLTIKHINLNDEYTMFSEDLINMVKLIINMCARSTNNNHISSMVIL